MHQSYEYYRQAADGKKRNEWGSFGINASPPNIVKAAMYAITNQIGPVYLQCNFKADDEDNVSAAPATLLNI